MSNASGSQSGDSAETYDSVDSGQSEDIENSLTGQGISDRETTAEIHGRPSGSRAHGDSARPEGAKPRAAKQKAAGKDRRPGGGGGGGGI